MEPYVVTPLAGEEVAGRRNPGEGEVIQLTRVQAEQPLRLGYISKVEPKVAEGHKRRRGKRQHGRD